MAPPPPLPPGRASSRRTAVGTAIAARREPLRLRVSSMTLLLSDCCYVLLQSSTILKRVTIATADKQVLLVGKENYYLRKEDLQETWIY